MLARRTRRNGLPCRPVPDTRRWSRSGFGSGGRDVPALGEGGTSLERPAENGGIAVVQLLLVRKAGAKSETRLRVLLIDGVLNFVGPRGQGIAIPDEQIDSLRKLLQEHLPYCSHPFLKIGQRVRIRSGALDGVEGILVSRSGERTLVVSVDAIERSLAVRIEGYDVEPI